MTWRGFVCESEGFRSGDVLTGEGRVSSGSFFIFG